MATVEESEKRFGKRWNQWTEQERIEHVSQLRPEDLRVPLNLQLAVTHNEYLPMATIEYIRGLMKKADQ